MLIEVSNTLTVENPTTEMVLWCKRNLTIPNPEYAEKISHELMARQHAESPVTL